MRAAASTGESGGEAVNSHQSGNDYDKAFELIAGGKRHVFDSFECAIQAIAPRCAEQSGRRGM